MQSHAGGNLFSDKALASSYSPPACFLNFMLKIQCVWDPSISLHLAVWFIFSTAECSLLVLQEGEEVYKLIYLRLSVVLSMLGIEGACSSSPINSL